MCDDLTHPVPPIATCTPGGDGHWDISGTGVTPTGLLDDRVPDMQLTTPRRAVGGEFRWVYTLECRLCRKPVPARQEKLFAALGDIAKLGGSYELLSDLAARLDRISP